MTTLDKGVGLAQQATKADAAGEYATALQLYKSAIEYMVIAMKHEKNAVVRAKIDTRVREYLARAEALNAALERRKIPLDDKVVVGGGDHTSTIIRERPNVAWNDVIGLAVAKKILQETVILPLKHPQLFHGERQPWRGILLYGPPGTGKSYLAKAVATEAASTFFSVSASDLTSKWFGESEKLVRTLFEDARAARPAIIFIDEIDSLCSSRSDTEHDGSRRLKTEMLVQMDGVGHDMTGILVLAATNTPWNLDAAMRRRFEKRIFIGLPTAADRATMALSKAAGMRHMLTADDFTTIGNASDGYSGADMATVVREAIMQPVRTMLGATHFAVSTDADGKEWFTPVPPSNSARAMSWLAVPQGQLRDVPVTMTDFEHALRVVKPSVGANEVTQYTAFTQTYGADG